MARSEAYDDAIACLQAAPPPRPWLATMLDRVSDAVPPAVDQALRGLRGGGRDAVRRRRALTLIWCILRGARAADAAAAAKGIDAGRLEGVLDAEANTVMVQTGGPLFRPAIQSLLAQPEAFLRAHRVFTHSTDRSGSMLHDFTFLPHNAVYEIRPATAHHDGPYAVTRAHNVHVQMYAAVRADPTGIAGAAATEDLVVTTQLSGCAVLYRVAGSRLDVAHVRPDAAVAADLPPAFAGLAGASNGRKLTEILARGGSLAGEGGTLGLYGCVDAPAEMGFRVVGRHLPGGADAAMRVHGYCRSTAGGVPMRAYFVAVRRAGTWSLFGQRNNPMDSAAGVESLTRIYPL